MCALTGSARVVAFSNHKGGVGKTCSTCNIGAGLSRMGKKVLLIDLDPQANLSISFGVRDAEERNIYKVLIGECKIIDATYSINGNLDLVASWLDLAGAEVELASEVGREVLLREVLEPLMGKYDYILIDCAPSLGLLTTNALTAASEILIPIQPQYLSLQGMSKLTAIVEKIETRLNRGLHVGGVFITQFDSRKTLNRDIAEAIQEHFADTVFKTRIRDNIALAEAPGKGQDIFRYSQKSSGAEDYAALVLEMLVRHGEING